MAINARIETIPAAARVRVRELCARKKCSLRLAAGEMGITPSLLSNYNSGKISPGLKHLLVMARYFKASRLDEIVGSQATRAARNIPVYIQRVAVPRELRPFMWDCPDGKAPLEKMVLRTLNYGNFAELRFVCRKFPVAARHIANTYPDIRRGVRYWVRRLGKAARGA